MLSIFWSMRKKLPQYSYSLVPAAFTYVITEKLVWEMFKNNENDFICLTLTEVKLNLIFIIRILYKKCASLFLDVIYMFLLQVKVVQEKQKLLKSSWDILQQLQMLANNKKLKGTFHYRCYSLKISSTLWSGWAFVENH